MQKKKKMKKNRINEYNVTKCIFKNSLVHYILNFER